MDSLKEISVENLETFMSSTGMTHEVIFVLMHNGVGRRSTRFGCAKANSTEWA